MLRPELLSQAAKAFPGLNLTHIENSVLAAILNARVEDISQLSAAGARRAPEASFLKALQAEPSKRHFILEFKQSSPTLGDFCKDFDEASLLKSYEKYADALSVLTEPRFFKGSFERLSRVKEQTSLPVLAKDFIISEKQIDLAQSAGADAVLLMTSVLLPERLLSLYRYAAGLGLDVLVEADSEESARFAALHRFPIVGVNNRQMKDLSIDFSRTRRLAPLFDMDQIVISESGIRSFSDFAKLGHTRNFLIGSALSGSENPDQKAHSLFFGLNKVCGITTREAFGTAIRSGAAMAGFVFYGPSPRAVSPQKAREIIDGRHRDILTVGVFVNESIGTVASVVKETGLRAVQLHGKETPAYIQSLKKALPGILVIKAVQAQANLKEISESYLAYADFVLLDSSAPGSGTAFDWSALDDGLPRSRMLLAGGIGEDNLRGALSLGFAGLDMNSRLESSPGVKPPEKIESAFKTLYRCLR